MTLEDTSYVFGDVIQIEFFVGCIPEAPGNVRNKPTARVRHIVFRQDTLRLKTRVPANASTDSLMALDDAVTQLPHLRVLTLETIEEDEGDEGVLVDGEDIGPGSVARQEH